MDNKDIVAKAVVGVVVFGLGLTLMKSGGARVLDAVEGVTRNLTNNIKK